MQPALALDELRRLLTAEFPEMFGPDAGFVIEDVWHGGCRVRQLFRKSSLRPGGTISGVTMMGLADFAMYVAVLAAVGWVPLAVTTNLTINFLRKPGHRDLIADVRLIKLGNRLAVGEIGMRCDGEDELVAHVTSTYSIPANGGNKQPSG
jgi:acyl-coenzyme A thioesterase PaaI-like protein